MYWKKCGSLVFIIGLTILTLFGCGGDTDAPVDPDRNDLMFKKKLLGEWRVLSVNDMEPSRFLTLLLLSDDSGFLMMEDERDVVFNVKVHSQYFDYTFDGVEWTLAVKFDVLPNDEATPVGSDAVDPGGSTQNDPIDPEKPAAPKANNRDGALVTVVGKWGGTYQVSGDMLTLMIGTEIVEVTPTNELFEEIAGVTEADLQAELTDKFRTRFINPFAKTVIQTNYIYGTIYRLYLSLPGSRGGIELDSRNILDELIID